MRTVAASEGLVIAAAMSGKIKTVLQMVAVPAC
jgi:phosphatidylglycerophosphate synthase